MNTFITKLPFLVSLFPNVSFLHYIKVSNYEAIDFFKIF